jgi:hypothetical protein
MGCEETGEFISSFWDEYWNPEIASAFGRKDSVVHEALIQAPPSTATDVEPDASMFESPSCQVSSLSFFSPSPCHRHLNQSNCPSQSDTSESSTSTNDEPSPHGCSFLRSVQSHLEEYPTTGGAYIEILFSHREAAAAFPRWHVRRSCVRGFSELAEALVRREWRADREEDEEAATSFRYEAMRIAVCE